MGGQHISDGRVSGQVVPLLTIGLQVIEFLRAIGVLDVSPAFTADSMIALIMTRDCRPRAGGGGVTELRDEAEPFQILTSWQPGEVDERGIEVEQFCWLVASLANGYARPGKDERHLGAPIPETVFADDRLLAQMPAVVAPDHDDGVVGKARIIEGGQQPTDLSIDKAGAGEVAADDVPPLVVLPEPAEPRPARASRCGVWASGCPPRWPIQSF